MKSMLNSPQSLEYKTPRKMGMLTCENPSQPFHRRDLCQARAHQGPEEQISACRHTRVGGRRKDMMIIMGNILELRAVHFLTKAGAWGNI